MRINDMMQASNIYRPNQAHKADRAVRAQAREEYSPSAAAKDYHVARRALKDVADIRQSLIDDIAARINAGTYFVAADDVAAAIIGG